ncbi:MAG: hypothetical protein JWP63_133 [Candidatus Solibacter sp.]|nr:hypothetical protein [Candidatus Solibacter sp.]
MKFAEWLLRTFGVDETLLGDLVEERGAGRSAMWLALQTAAAIATQIGRDLRRHPVLALRAIATGWLLTTAWGVLFNWVEIHSRHRGMTSMMIVLTVLVWPAFVGWMIAQTHRAQRAAMLLAYVASGVSWSLYYYTAHFKEIIRIPNQLSTDALFTSIILLSTLAGGFLHRPRRVH